MGRVIGCPACRGEAQNCELCLGRRRVLCFPYIEVGPDEELRLFRLRLLGRLEPLPIAEFLDEAKAVARSTGHC